MCQGVGEGFHATFYALLALGLRVVFAYALHKTSLFGYTAIWWSQAMSWTITLVVCYVHFFRGKWKDQIPDFLKEDPLCSTAFSR